MLRSYLARRCGRPELADDLTAIVFEHAAKAIVAGQMDKITTGWLMCVAKRRLVDHYRNAGRADRATAHLIRAENTKPLDDARDLESTELVGTLGALPSHHRDALVLHYVNGEPVAAVAEHLGISYRATESLLARARRSMRRELTPQSLDRGLAEPGI